MAEPVNIRQKVYDAIAESGEISRIQLSRKYHIRLATVTEVTRKLLEDNLIEEAGEEKSTGGRKPVLLKLNSHAFYTIGIGLSRTSLTCGLFSSGLEALCTVDEPTYRDMNGDELINLLSNLIKRVIKESGINRSALNGIGIGLPAGVNIQEGIYKGAAYYPNLNNVPIREKLEKEFKIPIIVDHDVSLMAMAEYYLSGQDIPDNLGVLFVGWGIGCRFILNGELYRGVNNKASEFGHLSLDYNGPECYCGNRGCLERLASVAAIEAEYGESKTFEEIVALAESGDQRALKLLKRAAEYIAQAIANIINLMDVEMLIINGDIVIAEHLISDVFHEALQKYSLTRHSDIALRTGFSRIGRKVRTLGPALMAADRYFNKKDINIFFKRR